MNPAILSKGKCDTDMNLLNVTKAGNFCLHNFLYPNCEKMETKKAKKYDIKKNIVQLSTLS